MSSFKQLSNDEAIRVAHELGYSRVEDLKGEYVEKDEISHYNLSQDKNSKEIILGQHRTKEKQAYT